MKSKFNHADFNFDFDKNHMVKTVLDWSNINTGSLNVMGLERFAVQLTHAFHELECEGNIYPLPPMETFNSEGMPEKTELGPLLSFWKRKEAPVQILLMGHMDTVYDENDPFQRAYQENDNILRGPGVADMKGGLCVMLEALKAFEKTKYASNLGWEVLINSDEELGSFASGPYLSERAKKHHVGLLFEPAMDEKGTLAGARKGSGKFHFIVEGRAAHAGRNFQIGRNAIVALSHIVQEIAHLNNQREGVTFNVGNIMGGGALNIVPAHAMAGVDVRFKEMEDEVWIQENLKKIIEKVNGQEGFKAKIMGEFGRKPKKITEKTHELYELVVDIGKSLGQNLSWQDSGGCSDGNNLSAVGLPNVDSLGVYGGKIHSPEEYMLIDSLEKRAQLTLALLMHFSDPENKKF